MLVISADWCSVVVLIIAAKSNLRWARSIDNWWDYTPVTALLATFLAFTLQGRARVCAVAAGFLMILFWWTSWFE